MSGPLSVEEVGGAIGAGSTGGTPEVGGTTAAPSVPPVDEVSGAGSGAGAAGGGVLSPATCPLGVPPF
jgi:hypothetical protein